MQHGCNCNSKSKIIIFSNTDGRQQCTNDDMDAAQYSVIIATVSQDHGYHLHNIAYETVHKFFYHEMHWYPAMIASILQHGCEYKDYPFFHNNAYDKLHFTKIVFVGCANLLQ